MVAAPRTWDELSANDFQHLDYRQVMARVAAGVDPLGGLHGQLNREQRRRRRTPPRAQLDRTHAPTVAGLAAQR